MESYVVLQQKLDIHKRLYKEADASIKRMNGLDKYENSPRLVTANTDRRKVSLVDDKSKKRKSYDEQKTSPSNNKRIVSTIYHESADEETVISDLAS
jgi:hypothetical protein